MDDLGGEIEQPQDLLHPYEAVRAAWLAAGKDGAVVSHESAIDLLDFSDVIPDAAHLTVPRSRRNLPSLPGVKIHTTVRPPQPRDLTYRDGMVVTSAIRTGLDAAEAGTAPKQIEPTGAQAAERGRRVAARIEGPLWRIGVCATGPPPVTGSPRD